MTPWETNQAREGGGAAAAAAAATSLKSAFYATPPTLSLCARGIMATFIAQECSLLSPLSPVPLLLKQSMSLLMKSCALLSGKKSLTVGAPLIDAS